MSYRLHIELKVWTPLSLLLKVLISLYAVFNLSTSRSNFQTNCPLNISIPRQAPKAFGAAKTQRQNYQWHQSIPNELILDWHLELVSDLNQIAYTIITHSTFKLKTPDFAWQFILILCKKSIKMIIRNKIAANLQKVNITHPALKNWFWKTKWLPNH